MSEPTEDSPSRRLVTGIIFLVAVSLAIGGITNSIPTYGVLPQMGPYPDILFRPMVIAAAVLIAVLTSSFSDPITKRWPHLGALGKFVDAALILAAWYVLWVYFDVQLEIDEEGFTELTIFHFFVSIAAAGIFLVISWRIWGAPLSIVAIVALVYFYTGEHWPWIFQTAPLDLADSSEDLWFNLGDGILGSIMGIIIFTVFPFILLGTMLERTGGGRSLIKIAVHVTRRFRGGPAHAAIMASGLFGTMSGGAVTNVVATGVITIPMIKQRGFTPAFAGGVEATASSAGQIMPPIMGAAAIVMSDLTGISFLQIIIAALVPALAYYLSLFTSVVFEARRLGVEVGDEQLDDESLKVVSQDYINMIMILVPVAVVVGTLIEGFSAAGAGMTAFLTVIPLSFLNPAVRKRPIVIIEGLAHAGVTFSRLLMAIAVVGIIVAVLGATGLPQDFVILINEVARGRLVVTLFVTAIAALMLGMGMPTLPAYLTIVLILGPAMQNLGLALLTAHMFVFYYGVASSITPPVAVAAYAAASIAEAPPISTAMMAMRIGLVKFAVPFLFAFYPVMLIVPEAQPQGSAGFVLQDFIWIIIRLVLFIYLVSSAVISFDQRRLPPWELVVRLALAVAIMLTIPAIQWAATIVTLGYLFWHWKTFSAKAAPTT